MFLHLAIVLTVLAGPAMAQSTLVIPPAEHVLSLTTLGKTQILFPHDIAAMETSESGGITDIFVRLKPDATRDLASLTNLVQGDAMQVTACGHLLMVPVVQTRIDSGTIYIPNSNAVRAEALRALWYGRSTCADINPEVFQNGP